MPVNIAEKEKLTFDYLSFLFEKENLSPFDFYQKYRTVYSTKKEKRILRDFLKGVEIKPWFKIIHTDIRDYRNYLLPESIDWIITDPPYSRKYSLQVTN